VDFMAETPSTVEEDSIAEAAVGSTAEACRTVEAVFTAAVVDAGNVPGIECTTAGVTLSCQPFFFVSALYPPPAFLLECPVTKPPR